MFLEDYGLVVTLQEVCIYNNKYFNSIKFLSLDDFEQWRNDLSQTYDKYHPKYFNIYARHGCHYMNYFRIPFQNISVCIYNFKDNIT